VKRRPNLVRRDVKIITDALDKIRPHIGLIFIPVEGEAVTETVHVCLHRIRETAIRIRNRAERNKRA
jgi:predicted sugar kinase